MAGRLIGVLIITLVIVCCDQKEDCSGPTTPLITPINDASKDWFQDLPKSVVYASSSNGRTVSYDIRYLTGPIWYNEWFQDCYKIEHERRTASYSSSLYDFNYNVTLRSQPGKTVLIISKDPSYFVEDYYYYEKGANSSPGYNDYEIDLPVKGLCKVKTYSSEATFPVVLIDSLRVKNTMYYDVYKIDSKEKKYNIDGKSRVLYFTPKFGLIRIDSFDGEVWELYKM